VRVSVLGGGIAGLAASYLLRDKADVTLIEKENHLGGLASSFEHEGYWLPFFYHHLFPHDNYTRKYLKIFGLDKNLRWKRVKVGIFADGKAWDFTTPIDLLKFRYLSPLGRVRYGWFGLKALFALNPSGVEKQLDARTWLEKQAGKEVTERIFVPLYAENKFNVKLEEISAHQLAMRLVNKEILGKFAYPSQGLHTFLKRFETSLEKKVRIVKPATVERINLEDKCLIVNGEEIHHDALISTIPIPSFLSATRGLPEVLVNKYSQIKYTPAVEVAFATENHLTNHYWLNVFRKRFGLLFQHSNLYDGYPFKFHWALRYGGSEQDLHRPNEAVAKDYLKSVESIASPKNILWWKVFRAKYAEPIFTPDYASIMPRSRVGVADLYYAGTATIYPRIRNMDASIQSGERAAQNIISDFGLA
jgi:protoporphyrinogen oxidase